MNNQDTTSEIIPNPAQLELLKEMERENEHGQNPSNANIEQALSNLFDSVVKQPIPDSFATIIAGWDDADKCTKTASQLRADKNLKKP